MNEYLLGSRKLKPFPVSMSLIARWSREISRYFNKITFEYLSYISGVTILGTPAEIYNYGSQYWLIIVPIFLMGLVVSTVYLPVFSSLKVSSSYEVRAWRYKWNFKYSRKDNFIFQYLELRFSSSVRTVASVMFVIDEVHIYKSWRKYYLDFVFRSCSCRLLYMFQH